MSDTHMGKVKFFNEERGFGFIKPDEGDDVYFPVSSISSEGVTKLNVDDRVSYTKAETDRGWQAENVTVVN
jgi:cold shock protein